MARPLAIPSLTDEHRATFDDWVDQWTEVGRSCDPADRPAAEAGVVAAYAAAGLAPPKYFVWASSPVGGVMAKALLAAAPAGVWDGVWAGVWDGVWAGVGDGVWAGVRAGVGDGVWAGVGDGVWDGVSAGVGDGVGDWSNNLIWGQHDAGRLSFYDWFSHHGMADTVAPLTGIMEVARAAGWWWPFENLAVLTDRPATLHDEVGFDASQPRRRRLHNEAGPSVTYRDGWALWHWHGQLVPRWVIESPTVERIAAEQNTEVRRCAIEAYGWPRYLSGLDAVAVSVEPDPGNPGQTLTLFDLPAAAQVYPEPVRLLVMTNGSPDRDGTVRSFAETVPVGCQTAVDAAAWQFDCDPDTYRQLVRAT